MTQPSSETFSGDHGIYTHIYAGQRVIVIEFDYVNIYLHSMVGKQEDGFIATLNHLKAKLEVTMLKTLKPSLVS